MNVHASRIKSLKGTYTIIYFYHFVNFLNKKEQLILITQKKEKDCICAYHHHKDNTSNKEESIGGFSIPPDPSFF